MLNSSLPRTVFILLSATRIIFSIPLPDDQSDGLISTSTITYFSPILEDRPDKSSSTFEISYASPTVEGHTAEIIFSDGNINNGLLCGTGRWEECEAFIGKCYNKDSKEYQQLQILKERFHNLSPPQEAAIRGYVEFIKVLLRNGFQVNKRYGGSAETLLHHAAEHGQDDVVALLLAQGANVDAKDLYGSTQLFWAVIEYQSSTVKLLLDAGAGVNVSNNVKETPLFLVAALLGLPASSSFYHTDVLLDFNGESKNKKYVNGKKIIKLLLEHGVDTNAAGIFGQFPLHVAAKYSDLTVVKLLVEGGANINVKNYFDKTPLHKATESNNVSVVKYLIKMDCDKTIRNVNDNTALDIAQQKNFTDIVNILSTEM